MTRNTEQPRQAQAVEHVVAGLRELYGDQRVSTSSSLREQHGRGESHHRVAPPEAVFFAESTDEVAAALRLCGRHEVPVVPFGVGTSLEGHVAALRGGLCIDLSRMSSILRVSQEDLDCTIQAGVTRKQLNEHLGRLGMFFPVDPGADASLGGMAATRASGTNAVGYGTMRENVLGLTVVLADGRVIRTGGRARKSSAGYDLTRMFVGSEGTLGVITEVTVRCYGIPTAISSAVCTFPSVAAAVDTVIETVQLGVPVARIELLDERQMEACRRYSGIANTVAPTLFLEFHGSQAAVEEQAALVADLAAGHGGTQFEWSTGNEDRQRLWQARHDAFYATLALRPGAKAWTTDVCVPISELAEAIVESKQDLDEAGLTYTIVGHVGDGNFHAIIVFDPGDPAELAQVERVNRDIVDRALAVGGTCTGEHGIGYGKLNFLEKEHGEAVDVMRLVKQALDPHGILNPGKVVRQ
jgi:D-lactate dehydrogenase (cytochrome)